ncbi:hypothetical protein BD309DRAFT_957536 [Dichomitus squalens]|nr:hypothetical protein BD309DRAFT_957536 [Dichomitus squalens]
MRHPRQNILTPLAALYIVSALPGAQATCTFDRFGREHCTLATGVRIAIAIVAVVAFVLAMIAFGVARRRRTQRANLAYVNTSTIAGVVPPPGYPPSGGYQPGYYPSPQAGPAPYYPDGPYSQPPPQFPPQAYDAQGSYAPPPGPPPAWSPQHQYVPPMGPPPAADYKQPV